MAEVRSITKKYSAACGTAYDLWIHARYTPGKDERWKLDNIRISRGMGKTMEIPLNAIDLLCQALNSIVEEAESRGPEAPF